MNDPINGGFMVHVYFKIHDKVDQSKLISNFDNATKSAFQHLNTFHFPIQKLTDIHFNADNLFEISKKGNKMIILILLVISIFFLSISLINFTILRTVKSINNLKELGIRKSIGASNISIAFRMILENTFFCFISSILAIGVTQLLMINLNFTHQQSINVLIFPELIFSLLFIGIVVGVISGIYPIYIVIFSNSISIIKNQVTPKKENIFAFKNVLLMLQFIMVSIVLSGSIIVFKQLDYLENLALGYDKDRLINIYKTQGINEQKFNAFIELLKNESGIEGVSTSYYKFISDYDATEIVTIVNGDSTSTRVQWNIIDSDFISTLNMHLVEGRNFSDQLSTDSTAIIINEAALKKIGVKPRNAIGLTYNSRSLGVRGKIIGVLKDWHFQSFNNEIHPVILLKHFPAYGIRNLLVKINNKKSSNEYLKTIKSRWEEAGISIPFEYEFVDDWFYKMIDSEVLLSKVVKGFTIVLLFLSFIGLGAIVKYYMEEQKKEFGIRKVFGADFKHILFLIIKHYLIIILISFSVAIPISIYILKNWLDYFVYHTHISLLEYIYSAIFLISIVVIITLLTSIQFAKKNPIELISRE
jgi:putative ABC transport system permease protein